MKKGVVSVFLLTMLLIFPLTYAENESANQEQTQTQADIYSGFERFIDNVRMFFTPGDAKVQLALEIREKEVNSALVNTRNGDNEEAEKNLERARERLQFVQAKVSKDMA